MLTGDNRRTAERIAREAGIAFAAELLPQDKAQHIATLKAEGHVAGMIGDGVNDAPALAAAQVSFAIGAVSLPRATFRKIKQNLCFLHSSTTCRAFRWRQPACSTR